LQGAVTGNDNACEGLAERRREETSFVKTARDYMYKVTSVR